MADVDVRRGLDQAFGRETPVAEVVEPVEIVDEPEIIEPEEVVEPTADEVLEVAATTEDADEKLVAGMPGISDEPAPFDTKAWTKETFGYDTPESLKAELEELKKPKLVEFANEDSRKINDLLVAGKLEEVEDIMAMRKMLRNSEQLPVEDKLKLKLKLQYPDFDDEDVAAQYNKQYGFDEDEIDETLIKSEKKKHATLMKVAATEADEYFKGYKAKIELPSIQPQAAAPEPQGPTAEQQEAAAKWVDRLNQSLSALKPEQAKIKTRFNDEANKMSFEVDYTPDVKGFEAAKESAKNVSKWLDDNFIDKEGNLKTDELTQLMYLHTNKEKVVQGILTQAKNNILRWQLANGKQINTGSEQRQFTTQPVSEVERTRKQVFG